MQNNCARGGVIPCCQQETEADSLALVCDCEAEQEDDSSLTEVMLGADAEAPYQPNDGKDDEAEREMAQAPLLSAGNTGHTLKSLPPGHAIHYLGLNQAQWSTLIMTYNNDTTSRFAGILIKDVYNELVSGTSTADPASGALKFCPRKGMTAMEAAVLIFCRWVTQYGVPERISSDNHGAFTAEVARFICDILGVKNRVFSAVYNSRSQAHIENRNKIISDVLAGAVAEGDVTNDTDLELYVAEAEIRALQVIETDGTTAFERCTGEPPRTVNSSLSAPGIDPDKIDECIDRISGMDKELARTVYNRCKSLMQFKAIQTDKRSRYNRAHLLAKEARKVTIKHRYEVGAMVSLGGRKVTLDALEPPDSDDPTTCWVTDRNGKALHVRVDSLRPLAAEVNEKLMPKDRASVEVGSFIVFDTEHGLSGGYVAIADKVCIVHDHLPVVCKTCITWGPLWKLADDNSKDPIRAMKCPEDYVPYTVQVDASCSF